MMVLKLPVRWLVNLVEVQEKKQYNFYVILIFALFVALIRFLLEIMVANRPMYGLNIGLLHMLVFYLHCIFIYTMVLSLFIPGFEWKKSIFLVLIGVFLGILPPMIDVFIYGIGNFTYAYIPDYKNDWTLFLYNFDADVPFGEALVLMMTISLTAVVVMIKTGSWLRTVLAFLFCYFSVFFFMALLPSLAGWLSQISMEETHKAMQTIVYWDESMFRGFPMMFTITLIQTVLCLVIYLILNPVLVKNILYRINHAIPAGLSALLGYSIFSPVDFYGWLAFFLMVFAFVVAIIQNDYFDKDEDVLDGRVQYVTKDDVVFFNAIYLIIVALFMTAGHFIAHMMLLFYIVSVIYSYDFYRGKRYFPASYKIEGVWGLSAFLAGVGMAMSSVFLMAGDVFIVLNVYEVLGDDIRSIHNNFVSEVWGADNLILAFMVFGGWSIISVIKDYKDIESDLLAGNQNAYTLLKKNGKGIYIFHKRYVLFLSLMLVLPVIWLSLIQANFISVLILLATSFAFYFVLIRKPSKSTVEVALMIINLYLANLVFWGSLSHG